MLNNKLAEIIENHNNEFQAKCALVFAANEILKNEFNQVSIEREIRVKILVKVMNELIDLKNENDQHSKRCELSIAKTLNGEFTLPQMYAEEEDIKTSTILIGTDIELKTQQLEKYKLLLIESTNKLDEITKKIVLNEKAKCELLDYINNTTSKIAEAIRTEATEAFRNTFTPQRNNKRKADENAANDNKDEKRKKPDDSSDSDEGPKSKNNKV